MKKTLEARRTPKSGAFARSLGVPAMLATGIFLAGTAAISHAADAFSRGSMTGSVVLGAGRALDRDYTTLGGTLGYMAADGLMLGVSAQMWRGNEPDIFKITPEIRYTFTQIYPVHPYFGAFLSRTLYDGLPDRNTYGIRGGVAMPFSSNAALNAGLVYEKISGCDQAAFRDCSQLYTEASVMFSF